MPRKTSDALKLAAMQLSREFCYSSGIKQTGYALEKALIPKTKRLINGVGRKNGKTKNHLTGKTRMSVTSIRQYVGNAQRYGVTLFPPQYGELYQVLQGFERKVSHREQQQYLSDIGDHAAKKLTIDLQYHENDVLNNIFHYVHVIPSEELLAVLLVSLQSAPSSTVSVNIDRREMVLGLVSYLLLMTSINLAKYEFHRFIVNHVINNDVLFPDSMRNKSRSLPKNVNEEVLDSHTDFLCKLFESFEWLLKGESLEAQREFCCRLSHADFGEVLNDIEWYIGIPDCTAQENSRGLDFVFMPLSKPFRTKFPTIRETKLSKKLLRKSLS